MKEVGAIGRSAHDLPARVNPAPATARIVANRAKVKNLAVLPDHRIMQVDSRQVRGTGDVARVVDPNGYGVVASQRAQIFHHSRSPQESVKGEITLQVRSADNIAVVVGTLPETERASQSSEVDHLPVF